MGTRNLTMVISGGKPRIAQYGQWDGYPSGQGLTALNFLHGLNGDYSKFKEKVEALRFATLKDELEIDNFLKSIGSRNGGLTLEQSEIYNHVYGHLSRDLGAKILYAVMYGEFEDDIYDYKTSERKSVLKKFNVEFLVDSSTFAGDGLFCEWVWVIDLDKGTFEAYDSFNKRPLGKTQRFYYLQDKKVNDEYYPVRCIKKFMLNDLPSERDFLRAFMTKKELKEADKKEQDELLKQ